MGKISGPFPWKLDFLSYMTLLCELMWVQQLRYCLTSLHLYKQVKTIICFCCNLKAFL